MTQLASAMNHIDIVTLGEGVYAAIHKDGGGAISNAGIIDLGDRTLIFDTLFTPPAAEELKRAAVELTGRESMLVCNSHPHNDHIWGNHVFADHADFIANDSTRQSILKEGDQILEEYRSEAAESLRDLQAQFDAMADKAERRTLRSWLDYYHWFLRSHEAIIIRPPNLTFTERFSLHGPRRRAELISCGPGHSPDDTVLFLPDDRILFAADLLFVNNHPFLADGDPDHLLGLMTSLADYDADIYVPGHGPVGSQADLQVQADYINALQALATDLIKTGYPVDEIDHVDVPLAYKNWDLRNFYVINVRFLVNRQSAT